MLFVLYLFSVVFLMDELING